MTVGLWKDQVLPMLHCSFTSEQVNFPIQFIYILINLGDFLPFWWFLIVFFFLFHRHRLQECHSFSKIFPRTIIFMDMTASYLFSSMLCLHKFLWHLASLCLQSCSTVVAFPSLPKPILTLQHTLLLIASITFESFHFIQCPKNNHLHCLWLSTDYFIL